VSLAIRRILLIHNIIFSIGGIPLIYLGDEVGMLNDYSYQLDPDKADDSRWVHRPKADPELYAMRKQEDTIPGRIYHGIKKLVQLRKTNPILSGDPPEFIYTGNPHVFGFIRKNGEKQVLFVNNFSDDPQTDYIPLMDNVDVAPDGTLLAFDYWYFDLLSDIYIMRFPGVDLRQLTDDPALDYDPVWRPLP